MSKFSQSKKKDSKRLLVRSILQGAKDASDKWSRHPSFRIPPHSEVSVRTVGKVQKYISFLTESRGARATIDAASRSRMKNMLQKFRLSLSETGSIDKRPYPITNGPAARSTMSRERPGFAGQRQRSWRPCPGRACANIYRDDAPRRIG